MMLLGAFLRLFLPYQPLARAQQLNVVSTKHFKATEDWQRHHDGWR